MSRSTAGDARDAAAYAQTLEALKAVQDKSLSLQADIEVLEIECASLRRRRDSAGADVERDVFVLTAYRPLLLLFPACLILGVLALFNHPLVDVSASSGANSDRFEESLFSLVISIYSLLLIRFCSSTRPFAGSVLATQLALSACLVFLGHACAAHLYSPA
eukprot:tig00001525_g9248.t1